MWKFLVVRSLAAAALAGSPALAQKAAEPTSKSAVETPSPKPEAETPAASDSSAGLNQLVQIALANHPRLMQAGLAIDAAQGRALQAGLYPNPRVSINGEELGDRQGPGGIWSAPNVSQEIVTGGKLQLSRAVALKEVDQATLNLQSQRYALLGNVRVAYYDLIALRKRIEILEALLKISEKSVEQTETLLKAKQVARLDLVQLELEREKLRTDSEAARKELPGVLLRLAGVMGVTTLSETQVSGTIDFSLPPYELERVQSVVLSIHPDVQWARAGYERAQLALRRAQVEPRPNPTVGVGYTRQNQNKSNDWNLQLSMPVPLWNKNQGGIREAQAEVGIAAQQVRRVEVELTERLAVAYREYAAALERAERYRATILPRAQEAFDLSLKAYQGGQFEYLRVLEAQRGLASAQLEAVRSLGDAWKAASAISGLTLEEQWPVK